MTFFELFCCFLFSCSCSVSISVKSMYFAMLKFLLLFTCFYKPQSKLIGLTLRERHPPLSVMQILRMSQADPL